MCHYGDESEEGKTTSWGTGNKRSPSQGDFALKHNTPYGEGEVHHNPNPTAPTVAMNTATPGEPGANGATTTDYTTDEPMVQVDMQMYE
eukprot:UN30419